MKVLLLLLISVSSYCQMVNHPYTKMQVYGYLSYLPEKYGCSCDGSPLLVFLHGSGEKGKGTTDLVKLYTHGPPKLIKSQEWQQLSKDKFVVVAPQNSNGFFNPQALHKFIAFVVANYKVDARRVYIVGLSAGAISIWNYIRYYGNKQVAAVIPICGNGNAAVRDSIEAVSSIPIWAFHGDKDLTVNVGASINPVRKINSPIANVTVYNNVGHDSWTRTFDLTGRHMDLKTGKFVYDSDYDPFDVSIYEWLLMWSSDMHFY